MQCSVLCFERLSESFYVIFGEPNKTVQCLTTCCDGIYRHFQDEGVSTSLYFMEWSMTLFTKRLNLEIASRIWDIVFIEKSERFVYIAAAGMSKFRGFIVLMCTCIDFDVIY